MLPPELSRGQNLAIPTHAVVDHFDVVAEWNEAHGVDIDLGAVFVDRTGRTSHDRDFVFFNNSTHPSGAALHLPQQRIGSRSAEGLRIALHAVPDSYAELKITISGSHPGLASIDGFSLRLHDSAGDVICHFATAEFANHPAGVAAEVYRRGGEWKVRAVLQGWDSGLQALVEHYGLAVVEDDGSATVPSAPDPAQPTPLTQPGYFGTDPQSLYQQVVFLQSQIRSLGALDAVHIAQVTQQRRADLALAERDLAQCTADLAEARSHLVAVDDLQTLQEVGLYDLSHPLDDSIDYRDRLTALKSEYQHLVRSRSAIHATTNWQVNGSTREGAKMVAETSKLMLRAYNAEADNCVRVVRAHSLESNLKRLDRANQAITKLGGSMAIRITPEYHRLRSKEIRLTADYHFKKEMEREAQREEKERLRDEQRAAAEMARAREKLDRERQKIQTALQVAASGVAAQETLSKLEAQLAEVEQALDSVESRAANLRAGYVYVISNIGAFGPKVVKIGMTRRLDPMDRVRELGDASVPFKFDVHALVYSNDALGLESALHREFADARVNRVNVRREFFYVTPSQVRDKLRDLDNEHLLDFKEQPIAEEWHRSGGLIAADV